MAEGGTGRSLESAKWTINASTGDFQAPCISYEKVWAMHPDLVVTVNLSPAQSNL